MDLPDNKEIKGSLIRLKPREPIRGIRSGAIHHNINPSHNVVSNIVDDASILEGIFLASGIDGRPPGIAYRYKTWAAKLPGTVRRASK